ncbi:hypothetical protein WR25_19353 isoform K [Diploscapter pachys]|uniref:Uncharacterized protein n=1 Tax=Diploscapter pachys TaxID=2018661 RepID=A0A2A2J1H9_9BILA|nr:hypothetical protein WR25_19353 isoform A [Diploscapter pachys]PAV55487.1 hypothetical protein WR25_19353 isoform B [Diploscapter pachys]PAV55488.1 hypothetical protein WR25_19353 isoform C [Diploscapter pachys]PAV55489.1 hypothetical protein WR25_19353 isoform D [Diploscapter pachys]PAV55490.1 hypothetical protein WR25_19353 isoform E [Diploscapter pachys]
MSEIQSNVPDIPNRTNIPTLMSNNFKTNGPWYQFFLLTALCILLLASTGADLIYIFVCHDIPTYFKLFVFCWLVNLFTAFYTFFYAKSFLPRDPPQLYGIVVRGTRTQRSRNQCQRCLENTFFIFFILSVSVSIILGIFVLLNDTTSNQPGVKPIEKCESALYNNVEIVILVLKTAVFILFVLTRVVFLRIMPESCVENLISNPARDPGINNVTSNSVDNIPEEQTSTAASPSGEVEANADESSFHMSNNPPNDH